MTQTALVTGASVGIGRATAKALSRAGFQCIVTARRKDKLDQLVGEMEGDHLAIELDVNDHVAVDAVIKSLPEEFSSIDLLVNNAGLALGLKGGHETDWQHWQTMIETNCLSLAYLTRQILPDMVARNRGHIINLGSIAGTYAYKGGNVYGATKAFVEQFSLGLRADLVGTAIRVTNLEPGMIGGTEFSNIRFEGDNSAASAVYENCQPLTAQDIAETIRWVVTQPAHVNINRIELMPVCQAPAGLAVVKGG